MKMFVSPSRIYLYRRFVDFRKSVNSLSVIVEAEMNVPVMSGALFIFCNKRQDKLKILYWDKNGFALWYKRLEKAKFKWPKQLEEDHFELNEQQLNWLLQGYDVVGHQEVFYQKVAH